MAINSFSGSETKKRNNDHTGDYRLLPVILVFYILFTFKKFEYKVLIDNTHEYTCSRWYSNL